MQGARRIADHRARGQVVALESGVIADALPKKASTSNGLLAPDRAILNASFFGRALRVRPTTIAGRRKCSSPIHQTSDLA